MGRVRGDVVTGEHEASEASVAVPHSTQDGRRRVKCVSLDHGYFSTATVIFRTCTGVLLSILWTKLMMMTEVLNKIRFQHILASK